MTSVNSSAPPISGMCISATMTSNAFCSSFRRASRPLMAFTTSGREALRKLEQNAFDVIVADMHMPEIGGAELFTEVMRLYPQTVRILLSDNAGLDLVLRSSTTAHQFLTKPCDAAT